MLAMLERFRPGILGAVIEMTSPSVKLRPPVSTISTRSAPRRKTRRERRANGTTVTRVGRKLDVRPDQLREWARRLVEREGGVAAAGVVEAPERELKDPGIEAGTKCVARLMRNEGLGRRAREATTAAA